MLKRRLLSLTAAAIMVVPATVLTALAATSASATTAVAASSQSTAAADCVYITDYPASLYAGTEVGIAGNGVNKAVTLADSLGNCFTLHYPYTVKYSDGDTYTAYEYQNGDGHCLWDNGGTIEVGAACQAAHPREEFYGIKFTTGDGWTFGDVAEGPGANMAAAYSCSPGYDVFMEPAGAQDCDYWNFPQQGS